MVDLGEDSRLVLDRMPKFVGHNVRLGEGRVGRPVSGLEFFEEADVKVDGFVSGAVERAGLRAGRAACGRSRSRKEHEVGLFVPHARGGGKRLAPVSIQGFGGGDHPAFRVLIRIVTGFASVDERGLIAGGLVPGSAEILRNLPRQKVVDDGADDSEASEARRGDGSAPANLDA